MATYRMDKSSAGVAYLSISFDDNTDRVFISVNDNGNYSSVEIDRNDFLETIRTILEEND